MYQSLSSITLKRQPQLGWEPMQGHPLYPFGPLAGATLFLKKRLFFPCMFRDIRPAQKV
jgi:hypothetical protein